MIPQNRGRARIGVFVPYTNTNLEPDMMMLRPEGVSLHFARLGGYDEDEIPDENQMADLGASDMAEALHLLQGCKPDVILYGCTSATLAHGPQFDRQLAQQIAATSGARSVTAAGALVHALKSLNVTRIGFASPYVSALNDKAVAFLAREGVETISRAEFDGTLDNTGQGALTPDQVFDLGLRADSDAAQAIVLSCTDMRAVEVINRLEQRLKKPVITSNQAMMFLALSLLNITDVPDGFGQLFERMRHESA